MLDRLDLAPERTMSRRRVPVIDEARLLCALDTILTGTLEAKAWAPALRTVELLGRHIGLWKNDTQPHTSLAEMINAAADSGGDEEQSP
jgi:hypothetical protein